DSDPILKNVVTMRNIISQLKASDSEPLQTYVTGDLATTADSSLGSTADLSRIEPVTIGAILILAGLFFFAIVTPFVPLATVIIAFGAMTLTTFTLLRSIGVGLGFGVLIALLVSLTLIPSLILIAGDRMFWPTSGKRFEAYAARARKRRSERPGYFRRAASFSVRRPVLVLGLALIISIPAIYIALTGSTSYDFAAGLPQAESVKGITALEQSFGAGQIGPTQLLVQFPAPILVNGNLTA